jgi:hypothetical protein
MIKPPEKRQHPKRQLTEKQWAKLEQKNCTGEPVVPKSKHRLLVRAYEGRSRQAAIKAMCFDCYGWEELHNIGDCPSEACPLWAYRPSQDNDEEIEEDATEE